MSDAWRPGLSQNIEEDEEIEDDHLVPPTPGQEHIDAASPSQDNASALSCLTSTSTSSKRPLMFMGEPLDFDHTAEDELMPYLAADVSETSSKVGLIEDCPGDDLESGFEKALSNAAAAAVGVNTTQWGTPPTSPLGSSATASSAITSIASNTATVEGTSLIATKTTLSSYEEHGHGELEKKENIQKGKNNGSHSKEVSDLLSDEEDIIPPSPPSRVCPATPTDGIPFLGSTSSSKRKHEAQELYSCSPSKQPKIDKSNSSNVSTDSGEEKVIVKYDKLTKKDVEISPKQQEVNLHTKPAFPSSISKRITFSSEDSSDKDPPPNRLPYETELDSDCEIIDDKNKSIEVVFEKPKVPPKSSISRSLEVSDSQELDLQLTGLTQSEDSQMSQMIDTEEGQRLSQTVLPYGLSEEPDNIQSQEQSQSQSQSLLPMPDSPHHASHDVLSLDTKQSTQSQGFGSMQVTQIEAICQPAEFTQPPDIDTLLSYPIQKKDTALTRNSEDNVEKEKSTISNGKESEESTKNIEILRKNSVVSVSQGCRPETIADTPRLKLPEISTPSSQEIPNTLEFDGSESVFKKVSKAVEKKLLSDKNNEQSKILFESSYEKGSYLEDQHGSSINSSLIEISPAGSSTVTSPVKVSQSSHSTPISSQAEQRILHTSNLFASGKTDSSFGDKSQQILVEESDSDEEGLKNRNKNKKTRTKLKQKIKNEHLEKVRKSSTPNTSHGISPNISDESAHSYIQKDVSSGPETSKSHNTSAENISGENSAADTQLLSDISDVQCTEEELILNRGYKSHNVTITVRKLIRESDESVIYVLEDDGLEKKISRSEMKPKCISRSGSGSSSSNKRISDISNITRSSGYSGYLGDKSSSSDTSRRISVFSNNSARLSISSVATISPPRPNEHQEHDDGIFAVPQARAVIGKVNKSTITDDVIFQDWVEKRWKRKTDVIQSNKAGEIPVDKVDSGRGRGSRAARGRAVRGSKTRGRAKGRGRGAISQDKGENNYDSSTDSQDIASLPKPPIRKKSPLKRNNKDMTKSPKKLKKFSENLSSSEELENILERYYTEMPLSEEEESAFMLEGGKDAEIQLDIVQDRVRHANLENDMLVFARFTDNNYYSACLISEDAVHNRWEVQYTLDRYSHSVRDVHILPTVLLPIGQVCAVRPDNQLESMNDTGIVIGHLREGKNLKHIIATDRGMTLHASHSHLVFTGEQIKRLLDARLKYRSMVASPGSEVSFDNICPGKRRRAPLVPYSSPGSKKEDPNIDTSDATAGESEDLLASPRKSPGKSRGRGRGNKRKNLFTVAEENESETELTSGSSTSRGRGRGRPPSSPRTPQKSSHKGKATPEVISDVRKISDSPLPSRILEIQQEELPLTSPSPKKRGRNQSGSKKVMEESKKLPVPLDSSIGPLPQKDNIFAGFTVLITNGDSSLRKQENVEEDLPELNKEHLRNQVYQGGGILVDTFSEIEILLAEESTSQAKSTPKSKRALKQKSSNKILLISNTFCRTAKYISCLAAGIPCVDFRWIIHCCTQNKYLDWKAYLLLAGRTDNGEFEQKINSETPVPSKILSGIQVFLASSSNPNFKVLWHPILVTTHAEVRDKPKNEKRLNTVLDQKISCVLADASISDAEALRARQLNIPIVSTTWLIDSIISRQHLNYSLSEKFAHDYKHSKPETVQDD